MRWIEALSPGASLPLRGSIVVVLLLLEELCLWDAPFFFLEGIFSRILLCWVSRSDARVAAQCERELSMESCLVALSSARGEGRSRRDSQSRLKIVRHRGAIEYASLCGSVSLLRSDAHWFGLWMIGVV